MAKKVKKLKAKHRDDLWLDSVNDVWFWHSDPDNPDSAAWNCLTADTFPGGFELVTSEKPNGKYGWGPFTRVKRSPI